MYHFYAGTPEPLNTSPSARSQQSVDGIRGFGSGFCFACQDLDLGNHLFLSHSLAVDPARRQPASWA
jgi:hypothetical protein